MDKLAISVICTGDKDINYLTQLVKSCEDSSCGVFITITSDKSSKVEKLAKQYKIPLSYFKWTDDFSEARNYALKQIPKEYTYQTWADVDDVFVNIKQVKPLLKYMSENKVKIALYNYITSQELATDRPVHIWKRGVAKWEGSIHERLVFKTNTTYVVAPDLGFNVYRVHTKDSEKDRQQSQARNFKLLRREFDKWGSETEPLYTHYLGLTYMSLGNYKKAIEFLDMTIDKYKDDELYFVLCHKALCYLGLNEPAKGLEVAMEAIKLYPNWSYAYFKFADIMLEINKQDAIGWVYEGFKHQAPQTLVPYSLKEALFYPLLTLVSTFYETGQPDQARLILDRLNVFFPNEEKVKELNQILVTKDK